MRYSKIFGKTNKSAKEYDSINATYLIRGGFIDQTMAGVYTYLPLGLRVINKLSKIVREEMDKISVEMLMPALSPKSLWETTERYNSVDVLFKASPANETSNTRNNADYVLNPTHEEVITPLAKNFNYSYKDLPFSVYQIQSKFRNEARPKSGLLRGREFIMKDLYSFHKSEKELKEFYLVAKEAYFKVLERVGLRNETYYVAASGGDFTDEFSHEFQVKCETGEDTIFYSTDDEVGYNREVAPALAPEKEEREKPREMEEVLTEGVTGVKDLCEFLKVTPEKTTKTIIYDTDIGPIVACVRGDYEINEEKLRKSAGVKWVKLATEESVKSFTGAEVGYAGIVNLPEGAKLFVDESAKYLTNFETGANKTNYHYKNVNWYKDIPMPEVLYDLKVAKEGDLYPETGKPYSVFKASEVGNIFPLNTKFTKAFNYYFTNEKGQQEIVYTGSYGLGISRLMGILVEKFHDDKGIVWPENVAPFTVHLVGLNLENAEVKTKAETLYQKLVSANVEVLYDDRESVSAGEKFADADLIGLPYRIVVSAKTKDALEFKKRNEPKEKMVAEAELVAFLTKANGQKL
ncbi:proline--tRNA ligase [candidate division WWE3 bacterium RIFOXYC1_FULL_39_7]|uniref:Proline--tRNA ligase n=2 Tax=Katanobacteria TaxID=422282 RepID=A0A1F4X7S9_UNCKA|nr:MAG: proline--tRNA ligase [candidate division WWE3 bacterium RIFOXYC1_FULL_39_7]OGC77726.1 MAG: proline--tRNA ligase [candidate division WWE3 bacterium RIFOXYD1_FULL_39_9]